VTDRLAKNTLHLTLASIGQKIIAFAYFLFLARIMMPELTGQYFLAVSITTIYSVIADFGITPVVIREIAKDTSMAKSLISHALGLKIPLITLATIGAMLTGVFLGYSPEIQYLIVLASIVLLLDSIHLLFYGVLRGFQSLKFESLGVFLGQLTTATFGGLVLILNPTLPLLVLALMTGSLVNVGVSSYKIIRMLGASALKPTWSKEERNWILKTAFPFALAAIFVKVYSYIDTIFISKFLDDTAIGIYAIAYKFTYAFQFLPLAFTAALYPGMSELVGKDDQKLNRILMRSMWYMAILSAPIVLGLYAIADEITLLAGNGYAQSAIILQTLVFVLLPIFLDFPVGSLLNASGRQVTKTSIMGATMAINVILNAIFIPQFGVMGAAYTAIISFLFLFFAGIYFVPSIIASFSYKQLLRTIVPIYASALIMLLFILWLKPIIGWIAIMPVGALIYIVSLWITGGVKRDDLLALKRV
jgi:O-antigen/teichoic acid export membrane protein